jgi:murein hydrolase activator
VQLIKFFLITSVLIFVTSYSTAQDRKSLEKERLDLEKKINESDLNLKIIKEKKQSEAQLLLELEKKIDQREQIITNLEKEVSKISREIVKLKLEFNQLQASENQIMDEYAKIMQWAFRNKINNGLMHFIFSSDSFNQAYQRWQLLKQYDAIRKKQALMLRKTINLVKNKQVELELLQKQNAGFLESQNRQKKNLVTELNQKNDLLSKLKNEEKKLISFLLEQEKAKLALEKAIENLSKTTPVVDATFETLKGKLPWPVSGGQISRNFGKQAHPTIKSLQIENNGIDISIKITPNVYSVAPGKIVAINYIPGYLYTVIVQHGVYFTVYSNIFSTSVKKGDQVQAGQTIGIADLQKGEVHFEIWKSKDKLNPIDWLSPKRS